MASPISSTLKRLIKVIFMLLELLLRIVIVPYFRAGLLRMLGAQIGKNVRIYEVHFFNFENGFKNFIVEDDVHIGMGCYFDLQGKITIERGATLSPRVVVLTHSDPGSHHASPLCKPFPPFVANVHIGRYCWVGTNATILAGSFIASHCVIGAASLVRGELSAGGLYYGVPVRKIKELKL